MTFPHRISLCTRDEIAVQDPYGGHGVQVPFPAGMDQEEAAVALARVFPLVPHVTWDRHAWLDLRGLPAMSPGRVQAEWIRSLPEAEATEGVRP
jgi:hypothetical protein